MKCLVHDYAGHPFQVQLSRYLARNGHEVWHLYNADNLGPKGNLQVRPDDPCTLSFVGVSLGGQKASAIGTGAIGVGRVFRDFAYGSAVAKHINRIDPDVVLCGNTPLDSQRAILRACHSPGRPHVPFVYWVQDIYSIAIATLLTQKLGFVGKAIGAYYQRVNQRQFLASDAIIAISYDFVPVIRMMAPGVALTVIENWAALDELPLGPKVNDWSRQHGLHDQFVFMYTGTLGRKHNPAFLVALAEQCRQGDSVVAVAQGYGVPYLEAAKAANILDTLTLLPLQPAEQFADVLATADVLLATIEQSAGIFAVPSKVLSYLCAGRPIILAASRDNLAARIVLEAQAGFVVSDEAGFLDVAERLRDPQLRAEMGAKGRAYAEATFDMAAITDMFQRVLYQVVRA